MYYCNPYLINYNNEYNCIKYQDNCFLKPVSLSSFENGMWLTVTPSGVSTFWLLNSVWFLWAAGVRKNMDPHKNGPGGPYYIIEFGPPFLKAE